MKRDAPLVRRRHEAAGPDVGLPVPSRSSGAIDGGAWYDYGSTTAKTSMTQSWTRGHTWQFRVRARDKVGNWGGWKVVKVKT